MRIKHITLMAGPEGSFQPNTERDVPDAIGRALVDGNYAIEVKRRLPEVAVATPRETATSAEQEALQALQKVAVAIAGAGGGRKRKAAAPVDEKPAPTSATPSADVSTEPAAE